MPAARHLGLLFAASLTGHVAGDSGDNFGDDFSNNLFSDLAPLLALFGERVTMQFMSQSTGWADNVILAMAPVGIITAIVGAIRVGGPSWLKAVIGRARENLAVAEAELMSSTSKEVCELWNGRQVVRCTGSAPVAEFICLLPTDGDSEIEARELRDLVTKEYLENTDKGGPENPNDSKAEKGQISTNRPSKILIARNTYTDAPNISLNSHSRVRRGEIRAAAAFGTVLQLGVLMYAGFATYYPTLKFPKEENPVSNYAFPCAAVGTLLLVAGMMMCGHVVENRTKEETYKPKKGIQARLVWLQQTQTVSDQEFHSHAIFAEDDRSVITTSSRADKEGHAAVLGFKATLGTMVSLCGYIVQFVGLRGLHFSASVVHLGAVLMMVCLRAWVRRGLAKPPKSERLTSGFELEWFAITLGDRANAPWLVSSTSNGVTSSPENAAASNSETETTSESGKEGFKKWRIVTGRSSESYEQLRPASDDGNPELSGKGTSEAHMVMKVRRDLGELAAWRGPASAEALSLARAIEVTMDTMFGSALGGNRTWSLEARFAAGSDAGAGTQTVRFRLETRKGAWTAFADEIEAALSLWLYSVSKEEQPQDQRIRGQPGPRKDDAWLRASGLVAKRSLRLLATNTPALRRDLQWWVPRDTAQITKVEKYNTGVLKLENHRVVGCGFNTCDTPPASGETRYKSQEMSNVSFDPADEDDNEGSERYESYAFLATESYSPLKLLYAQDMFSAFMWAAAKTLTRPVEGGADIRLDDPNSDDAWKSFTLRSTFLSKMAQQIQDTGLGSLDQIYLSIIPPLSVQQKLPQADAIIELAQRHARPHERLQHWDEAGDIYLWLFRATRTLSEEIAIRATAVLMEYMRAVTLALELRETQLCDEKDIKEMKKLKSRLEEELRGADPGISSSLMRLYETQRRGWNYIPVQETRSNCAEDVEDVSSTSSTSSTASTSYPETFNFTKLHNLAQSGDYNYETGVTKENVNAKDIHDWTPLHYAAANGSEYPVQALLNRRVDVNARDLVEWTPLHYACQAGNTFIVQDLLQEGAGLDLQGRDGVAPLHCAAMHGHLNVVRVLSEAGAALDVLDASGDTPLHWAAYKGYEDVVGYLRQDANKRLRSYTGRTALHLAAIAGMTGVAKLLVEAGANKEAKNRRNGTPLHLAAKNGHVDITRFFVDAGANKEAKGEHLGSTPLHMASMKGHIDIARLLLEEGVDKEARDYFIKRTPLHSAAANGYINVARLLLEAGSDKEAECNEGTPLCIAAANNHVDITRLLLDAGADKEAKDIQGKTPLHQASATGHDDSVRLLLEAGADKEPKDHQGQTPLHSAATKIYFSGHFNVTRLLLEAGTDKEAKDYQGQTPLHCVPGWLSIDTSHLE